ncbi:MAG: hypothetical protein C0418_06240 [Coriobacteriaceae bacterium]|nr:hypothetical protein [Coriobacteriaceae bacterium]
MAGYVPWTVSETELEELTPESARDLLVECFTVAQAEAFARVRGGMHLGSDGEVVRDAVRELVRSGFCDLGSDFDSPSAEDIDAMVFVLAREAASWGTPPEVIRHHMAEMRKVQNRLT